MKSVTLLEIALSRLNKNTPFTWTDSSYGNDTCESVAVCHDARLYLPNCVEVDPDDEESTNTYQLILNDDDFVIFQDLDSVIAWINRPDRIDMIRELVLADQGTSIGELREEKAAVFGKVKHFMDLCHEDDDMLTGEALTAIQTYIQEHIISDF